jgi:hypothetical protein
MRESVVFAYIATRRPRADTRTHTPRGHALTCTHENRERKRERERERERVSENTGRERVYINYSIT